MLRKIIEVSGDALVFPELKNFQGKRVELILREITERGKSKQDLKSFFGKLKFEEDGLQFQKSMRAEWEKREKSF